MKSIVVYKIVFLLWFLLLSTALMAQKPAIDLISSHHLYRHPEAIMDTAYTVNPPVRDAVLKQQPAAQEKKETKRPGKRKRRQIGPSLDSLFQKEESKTSEREKSPEKNASAHKRWYPVQLLIFIIALK